MLRSGEHYKELSGGFRLTTNNRMEILAAIKGLEALKYPSRVTLYTDSQYLVNAINKGWARRWQANDWRRNKKEKAANADLWVEMLGLYDEHDVTLHWVRGHAGIPDNERCDALAREAAQGDELPPDLGYEAETAGSSQAGLLE